MWLLNEASLAGIMAQVICITAQLVTSKSLLADILTNSAHSMTPYKYFGLCFSTCLPGTAFVKPFLTKLCFFKRKVFRLVYSCDD